MTRTSGAWRYLLRDGRFITASVQLHQEHVFPYVTRDGITILALVSLPAERLLLQLIQQAVSASPTTGGTRRTCRATSRKVKSSHHKSRD